MSGKADDKSLGWDDEIDDTGDTGGGGFTLLPAGEYLFAVKTMEKATSSKGHPMAKLRIGLYASDDHEYERELSSIGEYLTLSTASEWKLCQFFRAIGEKQHGERYKPRWDMVPGATGRCRVKVDLFTKRDGSTGQSNKVEAFLDPEPEPGASRVARAPAKAAEPELGADIPF